MEMFKFDNSKSYTIRFLEPKERHIHFPHNLAAIKVEGSSSYISCLGEDCPICSFLGKNRTLIVRIRLFCQDICIAFGKLFSRKMKHITKHMRKGGKSTNGRKSD